MSAYYNDIDPYCCKVVRKNIANGNLPGGYVDERDIRDVQASDLVGYQHIHLFAGIGGFPLGLRWANFPESIRVLTGGFPCQDISVAGKGAGIEGSRSGLWREMARLVCELRPDVVIVENSPALLGRGLSKVLGDLAEGGYDAEWQVLSAASIGAPHLRERIYIVAYPNSIRCNGSRTRNTSRPNSCKSHEGWNIEENSSVWQGKSWFSSIGAGTNVADPQRKRCNGIEDTAGRNDDYGKAPRWQEGASRIEQCGQDVADSNSIQRDGSRVTWNRRDELTDGSEDVPNPDRQSLAVGSCFGSYAREELTTLKRSCSTGTGQWAVERRFCGMASRIPEGLDRDRRLTSEPHTCIMGLDTCKEEITYATAQEAGTREILQSLQQEIGTQDVQWETGRLSSIQETDVLQPAMHVKGSNQGQSNTRNVQVEGRTNEERYLRDVRNDREPTGSSPKLQSTGQRGRECTDVVCYLSHEMALAEWQDIAEKTVGLHNLWRACQEIGYVPETLSALQKIWQSLPDEEKSWTILSACHGRWHAEWPNVPRLTTKQPSRVDRIKGLGNSIVPQIAEFIGRCILAALESEGVA